MTLPNTVSNTYVIALESVVGVPWDGGRKTIDAGCVAKLRVLGTVQQACCKLGVPLCLTNRQYFVQLKNKKDSGTRLTVLAAMLWA